GRLDRSFARNGVARVANGSYLHGDWAWRDVSLFPTSRRILLVALGSADPLLAFRPNGSPDLDFGPDTNTAPGRLQRVPTTAPVGPLGALQDGKLVLAWSGAMSNEYGGTSSKIELQRILNH